MANQRKAGNENDGPREVAGGVRQDGVRVIDSADLFQGQRSIVVHHEREFYRLLITRNNRLILQK